MKRNSFFSVLTIICALSLLSFSCEKFSTPNDYAGMPKARSVIDPIVWNGECDRAVAVEIGYVETKRDNASGPKIASNAHSADFPGIYFIWDSKQKDNGYLKVSSLLFNDLSSFTLTSKETFKFFDFLIEIQPGQVKTDDNCYVFFIPKVYGNKNINMVFVSSSKQKIQGFDELPDPEPDPEPEFDPDTYIE